MPSTSSRKQRSSTQHTILPLAIGESLSFACATGGGETDLPSRILIAKWGDNPVRGTDHVIKVGAATEVEMKEKKDRVDDALHATRAAVEEGIVPGGGVALLRAHSAIESLKGANADQDAGIQIIRRALEAPLRAIVANAGEEPSVVVAKVAAGKGNFGYNASSGSYGDLVEMGVVDPTKVARTALQNAASIASLVLTTEASVAEQPKEEKPAPVPAGMDY